MIRNQMMIRYFNDHHFNFNFKFNFKFRFNYFMLVPNSKLKYFVDLEFYFKLVKVIHI